MPLLVLLVLLLLLPPLQVLGGIGAPQDPRKFFSHLHSQLASLGITGSLCRAGCAHHTRPTQSSRSEPPGSRNNQLPVCSTLVCDRLAAPAHLLPCCHCARMCLQV